MVFLFSKSKLIQAQPWCCEGTTIEVLRLLIIKVLLGASDNVLESGARLAMLCDGIFDVS